MDSPCEVPCFSVKKDLDKLWIYLGKKVSYIVFSLVLSGLVAIAIFFGETITRRQENNFAALMQIQKTVSGIQGELKYLNGRKGKWGRSY